jgi:hypothetical protein
MNRAAQAHQRPGRRRAAAQEPSIVTAPTATATRYGPVMTGSVCRNPETGAGQPCTGGCRSAQGAARSSWAARRTSRSSRP